MVQGPCETKEIHLTASSQDIEDLQTSAAAEAAQRQSDETGDAAVLNALRGRGLVDALNGRDYGINLLQVTGAILFWRGVWCSWDELFGFSAWSEIAAIVLGLAIMTGARLLRGCRPPAISQSEPGSASSWKPHRAYKQIEEDGG